MSEVYILECVRTPIGRGYKNGMLHEILPSELLALTLNEVVTRAGIAKKDVEDVICGCVSPIGEQGGNIGRIALLKAGFPITVPGVQLNRMCGSGQQAIHFASQAIASGDMDVVIACGVELMSRVPMGSDWIVSSGQGTPEQIEQNKKSLPFRNYNQGISAEMISEKWKLTRDELDKFSGESHEKCAKAIEKGYFRREIMPIKLNKKDGTTVVLSQDEGIRVPVDYEKMAKLKSPFRPQTGIVTAANASQISDGASAILLCSAKKAKELGIRPRARIVARVVVGSDPELMLTGPISATQKVLEKANLPLNAIDCFEINEAFAPVVLAWQKELGVDPKKVNPNGGAIAHGHPLGATGCILLTKLVHELERSGGRYGLCTLCIGWGMAVAAIIENLNAKSLL